MSGFGGLLHRDGAPVEPEVLARIADRLAYRGADGMASWRAGPIGLVHARFWVTPEEVGEEQPVTDPERDLWLVADGRVDNRAELLARLGHRLREPAAEVSDARLLLAAYRELGDGFCDEILGDFAFALWDGGRRRLLLARDAMGMKQLFYAEVGSTIVFGSTIGSVLAALPEPPPLNRELIEAFLQGSFRHWLRETVYRGVHRFPNGHLLAADAAGVRLRRWWQLGTTFRGTLTSDEEWVEAFGEAFREAVRCRLRSTASVAVAGGGGVDSSAIACAAHGVPTGDRPGLHLVAMTNEETRTADEREYLDELAAWLSGVEVHRIPADRLPLSLGALRADAQPSEEPEFPHFRSQTEALFGRAARHGCRVVLSGDAANFVLGHPFYWEPRALAFLGWRELIAELPHFRAASKKSTLRLLAHGFLWPRFPPVLQEALRRRLGGRGKEWIRPAGAGSWRRRLPPLTKPSVDESLPPAARWAAQWVARPFEMAIYAARDVTAAHLGVDWRQPFLDRRVVDLAIHLPIRLRSFRGVDRRVLRLAMRGSMPERIRRRRSKVHFADVLDRALRHEERAGIETLLDKPRSVALDFVTSSVTHYFEEFWKGQGNGFDLLPFLCLESWLRQAKG